MQHHELKVYKPPGSIAISLLISIHAGSKEICGVAIDGQACILQQIMVNQSRRAKNLKESASKCSQELQAACKVFE